MITTAVLNLITGLLNGIYSALPAWNWQLGVPPAGNGGGIDNGWMMMCFSLLAKWDHLLPIHDAFLPIMAASLTTLTGTYAIIAVKYVINVVRGAGA